MCVEGSLESEKDAEFQRHFCATKSDLRLDVNIWTKPNLAELTAGAKTYCLKKNIRNVFPSCLATCVFIEKTGGVRRCFLLTDDASLLALPGSDQLPGRSVQVLVLVLVVRWHRGRPANDAPPSR